MTTRVSGTRTYHTIADLKNADLAIARPENPVYQQSSDIPLIADIFTQILDSGTPFFEQKYIAPDVEDNEDDDEDKPVGRWENTTNVVKFSRTSIDREGGEIKNADDVEEKRNRHLDISGRFEVSGANDSEYKLTFPIALTVNGVSQDIAGGSVGLTAFYRGSNLSRRRAGCGGEGRVLICLNGLWTTVDINAIMHKQTKNWIKDGGPRQLMTQGLQNIANTFRNYGADVEQMKSRYITAKELHDCMMASMRYKVMCSADLGKVIDIYEDTKSNWFEDDNPTAWRLYNSFTRCAEEQNSMPVRERILGGLYWPMAKAGIIDLPDHIKYPADYQTICTPDSVNSNHATEEQMLVNS